MASERRPFHVRRTAARPAQPGNAAKARQELLRAAWPATRTRWRAFARCIRTPPAADALKLADAQLVVARGYGFESWAAMKQQDRCAQ